MILLLALPLLAVVRATKLEPKFWNELGSKLGRPNGEPRYDWEHYYQCSNWDTIDGNWRKESWNKWTWHRKEPYEDWAKKWWISPYFKEENTFGHFLAAPQNWRSNSCRTGGKYNVWCPHCHRPISLRTLDSKVEIKCRGYKSLPKDYTVRTDWTEQKQMVEKFGWPFPRGSLQKGGVYYYKASARKVSLHHPALLNGWKELVATKRKKYKDGSVYETGELYYYNEVLKRSQKKRPVWTSSKGNRIPPCHYDGMIQKSELLKEHPVWCKVCNLQWKDIASQDQGHVWERADASERNYMKVVAWKHWYFRLMKAEYPQWGYPVWKMHQRLEIGDKVMLVNFEGSNRSRNGDVGMITKHFPLPYGWSERICDFPLKYYYYCEQTGVGQWKHPSECDNGDYAYRRIMTREKYQVTVEGKGNFNVIREHLKHMPNHKAYTESECNELLDKGYKVKVRGLTKKQYNGRRGTITKFFEHEGEQAYGITLDGIKDAINITRHAFEFVSKERVPPAAPPAVPFQPPAPIPETIEEMRNTLKKGKEEKEKVRLKGVAKEEYNGRKGNITDCHLLWGSYTIKLDDGTVVSVYRKNFVFVSEENVPSVTPTVPIFKVGQKVVLTQAGRFDGRTGKIKTYSSADQTCTVTLDTGRVVTAMAVQVELVDVPSAAPAATAHPTPETDEHTHKSRRSNIGKEVSLVKGVIGTITEYPSGVKATEQYVGRTGEITDYSSEEELYTVELKNGRGTHMFKPENVKVEDEDSSNENIGDRRRLVDSPEIPCWPLACLLLAVLFFFVFRFVLRRFSNPSSDKAHRPSQEAADKLAKLV